jgi:TRAP-type transport system periplasmic protein
MRRYVIACFGAVALLCASLGAAAADKTYELKIATVAPAGTPWAQLLERYKRNVEKESKGRIEVKIYLGGSMGDENAAVRRVAVGRLEGVGASTGAVATLVPELNVVEIPFMFRDAREADYILDRVLLEPMEELFRERNLVLGFWSENGFRHFGSNFKITRPEDLRGKRMRSQETFVHLQMWRELRSSPQAIPTTEVITALRTGAVDGFDQALLFAIAASWYRSVSHMTLSSHIYQPAVIAFNKEWFDGLPEDLQKVLIVEGRKIVRQGRAAIRKINPELEAIIRDSGVEMHTLTAAERKRFEASTAKVRGQFRARQGKKAAEILDMVERGLEQYRKRAAK